MLRTKASRLTSKLTSIRSSGAKATTRSLKSAIQVVMDALKKNPLPKYKRPAYPNYHTGNGRDAGGKSGSASNK